MTVFFWFYSLGMRATYSIDDQREILELSDFSQAPFELPKYYEDLTWPGYLCFLISVVYIILNIISEIIMYISTVFPESRAIMDSKL
jgi:hypothetical protein